MIELHNVSKYYPTDFGRHYVFRDVSLTLPINKSVGILGSNGSGKSTLLRLIGGSDYPSEGKIVKTGLISPPMGLTPGIQAALTAAENARFAGRIYGLERDQIDELIAYVEEIANIGKFFDMPIGTYSAGMRQRVSFAINMALTYDYYLFDEIGAGGDKEFRQIAKRMVQDRLKTSKFIMTSHNVDELLDLCDAGIVLERGELHYFDDIKDAVIFYGDTDSLSEKQEKLLLRKQAANAVGPDGEPLPQAEFETKKQKRERRKLLRQAAKLSREKNAAAEAPSSELSSLQEAGILADPAAREALIAKRRARVMARRQQRLAAQAAATTASVEPSGTAEVLAVSAEAAATRRPQLTDARRSKIQERYERRMARRTARLQAVQEVSAPAADLPPDAGAAVPGEVQPDSATQTAEPQSWAEKAEERRARRRMRIEYQPDGSANGNYPATESAEESPDDAEEQGDPANETSADWHARRERRRQKRAAREASAQPTSDSSLTPETAEDQALLEPPDPRSEDLPAIGDRRARRPNRRAQHLQLAAPAEDTNNIAVPGTYTALPEKATAAIALQGVDLSGQPPAATPPNPQMARAMRGA